MKRICSVLIVIAMLIGMLPVVAIPAAALTYGDLTYEITDGEVTITDCDSAASGALTIPAEIEGYPVTAIGDDAFYKCTGLTSVTIPDSVTTIGDSAFNGCSSLQKMTLPCVGASLDGTNNTHFGYIFGASYYSSNDDYVPTSLKSVTLTKATAIGNYAFYECTGLTSVTIPDSVTTIGDGAFDGCTGLTSVTIPDSVTTIGYSAFDGCTGLTNVTIGNGVTSIGDYAFYKCTGLTSVKITDLSVWCKIVFNSYSNPLYYAKNLYLNGDLVTDLIIPSDVTTIGDGAFDGCTGLTSVTIPDSVTTIGYSAFQGCTGLTSVVIGNGVTTIGYSAFRGCTGLTSVVIGNGVTTIGDGAFDGCTGLTSVTIPDSVTTIGDSAFQGCTGLTSVTIPDSVTTINYFAFRDCTGLTSVTIPDSVTSIAGFAFADCSGLTSVTLGKKLVSIAEYAFDNCHVLQSVYYRKTQTDRQLMVIGSSGNVPLLTATWYYESCIGAATHTSNGCRCSVCGDTIENPFKDIKTTDYYYESVLWAVEEGITNGIGPTTFGPIEKCNRGQVATFLWRAAGCPEPTLAINPFTDIKPTDYYYKAVLWAVEKGITNGTGPTTFSPNATCNRGQIVTFLYRFAGNPATESANPFTDVKSTDYYYKAVLWAVEKGITNGTGPTTFSPNATCERGQVVTFLYRFSH